MSRGHDRRPLDAGISLELGERFVSITTDHSASMGKYPTACLQCVSDIRQRFFGALTKMLDDVRRDRLETIRSGGGQEEQLVGPRWSGLDGAVAHAVLEEAHVAIVVALP
jgi:hypothetical protein